MIYSRWYGLNRSTWLLSELNSSLKAIKWELNDEDPVIVIGGGLLALRLEWILLVRWSVSRSENLASDSLPGDRIYSGSLAGSENSASDSLSDISPVRDRFVEEPEGESTLDLEAGAGEEGREDSSSMSLKSIGEGEREEMSSIFASTYSGMLEVEKVSHRH